MQVERNKSQREDTFLLKKKKRKKKELDMLAYPEQMQKPVSINSIKQ